MSKAINILEKIVENGCDYAQENSGDIHCFYCGQWLEYEEHDEDCVYVEAKKIIENANSRNKH